MCLSDFFIGRVRKARYPVIRHDEAAIGPCELVLHEIGVVGRHERLEATSLI